MPDVPECGERDPPVRPHPQVRDAAMSERHAQPRLGRQLKRAAHKVADNIRVAYNECHRVGRLLGARAVKVLFKGGLDARR